MTNRFDNSNAPKIAPKGFVRGDYVAWRNSSWADVYVPADHTLTYNFRREGEPSIEFTVEGSADAGEYLFEILVAASAAIEIGLYHWDLYIVEDGSGKRITVDQGRLRVHADKATDTDDPRTFPRIMLAEIERAMLGRATNNQLDTLAYSIGVETSATRDPSRLKTMREQMQADLIKANRKDRARRGLPHSGKIKVRF